MFESGHGNYRLGHIALFYFRVFFSLRLYFRFK